jgi:acetate kinase
LAKTLLEKMETEPDAAPAVEMLWYYLRRRIASRAVVLGGVDTVVFTGGGIGEKAVHIRLCVCKGLEFLGVILSIERNKENSDIISAPQSACTVRIIPTKEDLIIARHTNRLIRQRDC